MTAEHVLTPDDKCPCGKPQTGSGYCSYECYSKHEPEPASMGGPLSEAEGAAARIRAYLEACSDANSFGREIRWELRDADGHPYNLPRADLVAVLDALGVLEGQLATVQERHQPVRRYHGPDTDDRSFETPEEAAEYDDVPPSAVRHFDICKTCGDMEVHDDEWRAYEWSLWPCKEAVALGLDGGDPDGR